MSSFCYISGCMLGKQEGMEYGMMKQQITYRLDSFLHTSLTQHLQLPSMRWQSLVLSVSRVVVAWQMLDKHCERPDRCLKAARSAVNRLQQVCWILNPKTSPLESKTWLPLWDRGVNCIWLYEQKALCSHAVQTGIFDWKMTWRIIIRSPPHS